MYFVGIDISKFKHGLTIIEDDALNMERSKRIAQELSAICKYCGIDGFDLKK